MKFFVLLLCCSFGVHVFSQELLYYSNLDAPDNVNIVDVETDVVVGTIFFGDNPIDIFVTPDRLKGYVGREQVDVVSVFDAQTNVITGTVMVSSFPGTVEGTPDGKKVYVGAANINAVRVIDVATDIVIATITTGNVFLGMASRTISDGVYEIYTSNFNQGSVSVIDTTSDTVIATIPVGANPAQIILSPDQLTAYVANRASGTVSVIDAITKMVKSTIVVGVNPRGVGITSDGEKLYVSDQFNGSIYVVDVQTELVLTTIPVTGNLGNIDVSSDGSKVYVANFTGSPFGGVEVIDPVSDTIVDKLPSTGRSLRLFISKINEQVIGQIQENKFLTQTELSAHISWKPLPSAFVSEGFRVYRDENKTDLIAALPPTQLEFVDHSLPFGSTFSYFVFEILDGKEAEVGSVTRGTGN